MQLYDISLPSANEEIDIASLRELNKALRLAARGMLSKASVGHNIPQAQAYVGGDTVNSEATTSIDPLIPQSIQPVLTNMTFDETDIFFWNTLTRYQVSSPVHEWTTIRSHGSVTVSPFFGEGRVGALSEAQYARGVIKVKYMMEYIQLTDVAAMLGTVVNNTVLAQRTFDGTLSLLRRIEWALIWGNATVNALAFDGLYWAIKNADKTINGISTYYDNRGGELPLALLNYFVAQKQASPTFAKPTHVLCTFEQYQAWKNSILPIGRVNVDGGDANVTIGKDGEMYVVGVNRKVPIVPMAFLAYPKGAPATAAGDDPAVASYSATWGADDSATTGLWSTADLAMDIYVTYVAHGEGGHSARVTPHKFSAGTLTASTDTLTIDLADSGATKNLYYSVFIAKVAAGATAPVDSDYYWVGDTAWSGSGTAIVLSNAIVPGTAPVFIIQNTPDVMQFSQLLDLTRRQITVSRTTTMQFALMLFGSFTLMVPTKCHVVDNVAPTWQTAFTGITA